MNATTFFTEETYNRILADIKAKKCISYIDCPYKFTHKTNGNKYTISLHTGYSTGTDEFFYSLWIDYNFANPPFSRSIGGGTITPSIESYEAFKESINRRLCNYPDYKEEEETPTQLCIVF